MVFDDHKIIEEQGIIEKYALGNLSPNEEEVFEEHLLYCDKCRKRYRVIADIISGANSKAVRDIFKQKSGKKPAEASKKYFFLKIAAGIIVLIGIAGLFFYTNIIKQKISPAVVITDTIPTHQDSIDTSKSRMPGKTDRNTDIIKTPRQKENQYTEQYAGAFKALPYMEAAIEDKLRGEYIQIVSPADSLRFKPGETITFNWMSDVHEQLTLVIKDNKGRILKEKTVQSPYKTKDLKIPGLYYWQLNTADEMAYCGKFYISIPVD